MNEVVIAWPVRAVNVSTASTRKVAVVSDLLRSVRAKLWTAKLGLGAAKRHWVHRWVLGVAPSRARRLVDRCDLEDEGRDILYGVVTDQIISWVSFNGHRCRNNRVLSQ
jgi:hypothetical protein